MWHGRRALERWLRHHFIPKLKIINFQQLTKLAILVRSKLCYLQSAQHNMPNKLYKLVDCVYEKHISVCHGRRALEIWLRHHFIPKLKIINFQQLTKLAILVRSKMCYLQSVQHNTPNKQYELIDCVYEQYISACHGKRTIERLSMALLPSELRITIFQILIKLPISVR